jgi:hypothetical protein
MNRFSLAAGIFFLFILQGASQTPTPNVNGQWRVEGVASAPWVFDLASDGKTVTGRIRQRGPAVGPAVIFDGRLDGSTISFKVTGPVSTNVAREITFTGLINNDEIAFERGVEMIVAGGGGANINPNAGGLFGTQGIARFVARRTGPAAVGAVPLRPASTPVDLNGRWESLRWLLDVWNFDLKSEGTQLTGTVSVTGGPGREAIGTSGPIYDGKIDGNTFSFKAKSQDNVRTITFQGKAQDGEIMGYRTVEYPEGGAVGLDTVFGVFAPSGFAARRVAARPPALGVAAPLDATSKQIEDALAKWNTKKVAAAEYYFTVEWDCLCPLPGFPLNYRVRGQTSAVQMNPASRALIGMPPQSIAPMLDRYGTIDKIFDLVKTAAARRPYAMKVEFDPEYGYPTSVRVSPVSIAADDDLHIRISGFRVN